MGVRGLQTFLKNNQCLSNRQELSDTNLVIDANNLLCYLYFSTCSDISSEQWRDDIYGGDLVAYSQSIARFFGVLERCGITPILVFDGSVIGKKSTKDQQVLKDKTVYKRGYERFKLVQTIKEDSSDDRVVLPNTLGIIFNDVVRDLGIQRIQSPYEADTHIARIANDLNCPVLTNDSDFLIYSLPRGFIMLDLFHFKKPIVKDGKNYISCYNYSHLSLIKYFPGLKPQNMPLLSVILGNDYIEAGTFDRIINSLQNESNYVGPLLTQTFSHRKIAFLLNWLKNKTLDDAIEFILGRLQPQSVNRCRQAIKVLLRSYKIEETDVFEKELSEIYPPEKASPMIRDHPELMPANYIRRLFESKALNSVVLDIIFKNTYYNYPVIDDHTLPSSDSVRYRPFSLALSLLRPNSYSNMTTNRRQMQTLEDSFNIYDRLNSDYVKMVVRPMEKLEPFGSIEHFDYYSSIMLEPALKKTLVMSAFRFNVNEMNLMTDITSKVFKDQFVHESCMCFMLVKYIGLETKLNPKPQFVNALMLTIFYYASIDRKLNRTSIVNDSDYGQILLQLRPHSIKNNSKNYQPSESLYRRIAHFTSQLASAYRAFGMINTLFDDVFPPLRLDKFFNGTLIFRLTKLMRLKEIQLSELCKSVPILIDTCNSVRLLVNCDE